MSGIHRHSHQGLACLFSMVYRQGAPVAFFCQETLLAIVWNIHHENYYDPLTWPSFRL